MSRYLLVVLYALLAVAVATPIIVSECGRLDKSFSTYKLMSDIVVKDNTDQDFVCFDITGKGITLDGNGFELSAASSNAGTGVQYSGVSVTVTNLHIKNIRTGIHAKGKFGYVYNNVVTRATNGIDVSATNNRISSNIIGDFQTTDESASGIYVYFPAIVPVDSYVNITNNVISDIKGDSFAQGISIYHADSVHISHNRVYNIFGALMSQDISVIESNVDTFDNVFAAPPQGMSWISMILTAAILLSSLLFFRSSSPFRASSTVKEEVAPVKDFLQDLQEQQAKEAEAKKAEAQKYGDDKHDEFEPDGADVVPTRIQRFSLSSSSSMLSSPIIVPNPSPCS